VTRVTRIVVTSGEPAGIGPDICLKVAQREWPCELVVAGDSAMLAERAALLDVAVTLNPWTPASERTQHRAGSLSVLEVPLAATVEPGRPNPANARYVLRMLDRAVAACQEGGADAMVTAPVQKSLINEAGIAFTGHTEYIAERTRTALPVMLLLADRLRVALATTHLPLAKVPAALSIERLSATLAVIDADMRTRFGFARPRILVCGLNPHAGEAGHLGTEERDIIQPAIEKARASEIDAAGPVPADTAFTPRSLASADVVLAMYHDQGLPVLKYAGFGNAVNITLGLPIVRTSVDHGTALALAGTGQADEGSLEAAIGQALAMVAAAGR
jgi:4-hydroxythreonine-4-phosphate dehydrogenase